MCCRRRPSRPEGGLNGVGGAMPLGMTGTRSSRAVPSLLLSTAGRMLREAGFILIGAALCPALNADYNYTLLDQCLLGRTNDTLCFQAFFGSTLHTSRISFVNIIAIHDVKQLFKYSSFEEVRPR